MLLRLKISGIWQIRILAAAPSRSRHLLEPRFQQRFPLRRFSFEGGSSREAHASPPASASSAARSLTIQDWRRSAETSVTLRLSNAVTHLVAVPTNCRSSPHHRAMVLALQEHEQEGTECRSAELPNGVIQ